MRFQSVEIRNFRAISHFHATDLSDLVVIAGPNGCGKSCILDAIRLLKSIYGGYQTNEWMQWFGEFQVNINDRANLENIFRDKNLDITVAAVIELAAEEISYISTNAERLCEPAVWSDLTRLPQEQFSFSPIAYAAQFPDLVPQVNEQTALAAARLRTEAGQLSHTLSLTVSLHSNITVSPSLLARILFQTFEPDNLGIIDFHSASRNYAREALGGINLDVKAIESQRRTQTLYNAQAKYQNVKSELATMYIRSVVAESAGGINDASRQLDNTLKELFRTFFPDKEYLGVQGTLDGSIQFPVRLATGEVHDINDLSSGEKEVLYGYLRLRSSTPHHSTILLDEPELHLNPGLLQGFPDFYYRHLSQAHGNQLWLVTHSDALLRQAVDNPLFSVFHMTSATNVPAGTNQAVVVGEDDLQSALLDLVGDLAAYRPTGKVLIFEGGGQSEFDISVVRRLFPEMAGRVNLVSGGSRGEVEALYAALNRTAHQTGFADRFFAITDRDSDTPDAERPEGHVLKWNVYHIENYLLHPEYIFRVYNAVTNSNLFPSVEDVSNALRKIAERNIGRIVLVRLQRKVNDLLTQSIKVGAAPDSMAPAADLLPSITSSLGRIEALKTSIGDEKVLGQWEAGLTKELRNMITNDTWMINFPGRNILRGFVNEYLDEVMKYEGFINLILNAMVGDAYVPEGMAAVLEEVRAA